jgi:hypothetical protein
MLKINASNYDGNLIARKVNVLKSASRFYVLSLQIMLYREHSKKQYMYTILGRSVVPYIANWRSALCICFGRF